MLIIAFGDVHMQPERAKRIPEIRRADCIVVNGDLTIHGGRAEALSVVDALSELNGNLYAHIGNMDEPEVDVMFTEMGINLNGRGVLVGDVGLFGLGGSPPTPFNTPSEFSERELEATLRKAYEDVKEARIKILFSHPPPCRYGCGPHRERAACGKLFGPKIPRGDGLQSLCLRTHP